jgi:hypothetical protein
MVETISVGGATPCLDGSAEASDVSLSYDGVPDLCGLAGRCGGFVYGRCVQESRLVPQPVPPSTGLIRGWIYRTETSAACAMVAGVAALVLAKFPGLGPGELRRRLRDSAVDVARGVNASSVAAQPGRDAATGAGLVHAAAACT